MILLSRVTWRNVWNPFTIKTLLEIAGLRMGGRSAGHVSPEHGCLELLVGIA